MPLKYGHLKCWGFFYCSELSEGAAASESPCLPSSHTQPRLLCLLRNWRRALVEWKRAKERRKKVNNSTQTVYGRCWGKRVISAGLPLGASCFSALFKWISPPTPSPVPILPFFSPQSLFPLSLSFFFLPPPLHTFLSFVFISPPAVFLDRNLTHAFPFRISIGLFCPLFSPCLGPLFFLCLLSQSETAASLLGQDDSALAFPVPALPTSVQLLSPGRGGFGMVGWQRQGDWYKNEVQKRGERELGGGREMV